MTMRIEEFDYFLPKALIAQHPEKERASSRLLVLNRKNGAVEHRRFTDVTEYLREGDVLVLNDSKVFPARLKAVKETGGAVDILLVEKRSDSRWLCLVKGIKKGTERAWVSIGPRPVELARIENGTAWEIDFLCDGDSFEIIREHGTMPLPGYIRRKGDSDLGDFDRYQTVYADPMGSIAAPTAGFHFTVDLLEKLERKGVFIVKVTLHIGIGTFLLLKTENVEDHAMHREYYSLSPEAKTQISVAREQGRRVVACGTSAVRTLETVYSRNRSIPLSGFTDVFIYPGYSFKAVGALITNFHLPRSTPLLLASAFAGRDEIRRCYEEAIEEGYRFYSYGDAMLIV
ncbi:MAG: tRNA preQ1(34) S-adenosylmethionine ribosyltransferase-isomerase QueA [Syntrophobacterales bacterium]|jgi:S-adenosylmethionine:tRNA ribosyltransferase-isomerase|nr:tRNA preQ1(34) S-adenosylmethionine ribosyltransferase-isomerase QueA [Syntrophobacterales bacterium]